MRRPIRAGVLALVFALAAAMAAPAVAGSPATYQVTVTNLTGTELLTPFVVATHRGGPRVFREGRPATYGLRQLAENGGVPVLADELTGRPGVSGVAVAGDAPVAPGASVSVTITADPGARRLSLAGMIICSNDGFAGIDSVRLPMHLGGQTTVYGNAYDAGSEINTEAYQDLVPPCDGLGQTGTSNPALAEHGVVTLHAGIQGVGDLDPAAHGWSNPVILVTVERTG